MYRNLTIFRFPAEPIRAQVVHAAITEERGIGELLAEHALKPVGPLELSSRGWVSPWGELEPRPMFRHLGETVHLALGGEDKLLPPAVVNRELAKRLDEAEEREGRRPGGRARKRMKDEVVQDLLPRALVKPYRLDGYLDLRRGLLVVDTASRKAAEEFASMLRLTLGSFPALPLNAERSPRTMLTGWVDGLPLPEEMSIADEARLQDGADGGGVVTLKGIDLRSDEVAEHLDAGKQCTQLGLYMGDRLGFTFGEDLVVRKLRFLDGAMDQLEGQDSEDLQAELDARATLLVGEVGALFDVLEQAFRLSKVEG